MTPPNPISQSSLPDWPCTLLSGSRAGGSGGHSTNKLRFPWCIVAAWWMWGEIKGMAGKIPRNHPIVDNGMIIVPHWTEYHFPRSTRLDVLLVVQRGGICSFHLGFPGLATVHDSGLLHLIRCALSCWVPV